MLIFFFQNWMQLVDSMRWRKQVVNIHNTICAIYFFLNLPFGISSDPEIIQLCMFELIGDLEGAEVIIGDIFELKRWVNIKILKSSETNKSVRH